MDDPMPPYQSAPHAEPGTIRKISDCRGLDHFNTGARSAASIPQEKTLDELFLEPLAGVHYADE